MVNIEQVKNGVARYVDDELVSKMNGLNRWIVGGVAGVAIIRAEAIFKHLKEHPFIKMLEIVDENDMIDIDIIYREFLRQARRGEAIINIPLIGETKFNDHDIELLYKHIMGGENG